MENVSMVEMLSQHISRAEFEHSARATALGIANTLPEALAPAARTLCREVLEPVWAYFGRPLIINSGYRNRTLNRTLGSKDSSQHCRGEAADIEIFAGPDNAELARWILHSGLPFDQLILESYTPGRPRSGWVHVSHAFARHQRRQALTMTLAPHGAVYRLGIHA
jgi:zinc D-Ala-D-Ala carboxypeptidase